MKVTSLEIKRTPSYDEHPNELRGIVTMTGPYGQQTVVLSNAAICAIFNVIKDEVRVTASNNAEQSDFALNEAKAELRILAHEVD